MSSREAPRALRQHRVEWWVVAAWTSLGLLVVAGLAAAAGIVLG